MRLSLSFALLALLAASACADGSPVDLEPAATRSPVLSASITTDFTVGQPAPALSAFDVGGTAIALTDYAGSYLLLEVGGGWCDPSRKLAPFFPLVDAALVGDGIPFATASVLIDAQFPGQPSNASYIQTWLNVFYGGAYQPVLHVNGDAALRAQWEAAAITPFGGAIPMLFLLAPDGTVLRTNVGAFGSAAELEAWVREGIAQGGAPTVETIVGPSQPVAVGQDVRVTGTWSTPDADLHTGVIDWGDGSTDPLVVNADGTWSSPVHRYADIGFYRIEATITDAGGASDSATLQDVLVVDPDGGFVVGAGSVLSPAGACAICAEEAPARFRLLSRYRKGASQPSGDFVFRFESGEFAFESMGQDWLLVNRAGTRAQVKGKGRIVDGPMAGYGPVDLHFMAWLDDASPDALTLRIWIDDPELGTLGVYDSMGGMPLQSGNVLVRTGR